MLRALLGFLLGILFGRSFRSSQAGPMELRERILVGERPAAPAAAGFCEGTYVCYKDGTTFKIGARSKIGFWNVETCPGTTTLSDGSGWNLVAGTCDCP